MKHVGSSTATDSDTTLLFGGNIIIQYMQDSEVSSVLGKALNFLDIYICIQYACMNGNF